MLVIRQDYLFSHKDVGKKVMTSKGIIATIMTVIKEQNTLYKIYGKDSVTGDILTWDGLGRDFNDFEDNNIVAI